MKRISLENAIILKQIIDFTDAKLAATTSNR